MPPPQNRNLDDLHPLFRAPFEMWLQDAAQAVQHVDFIVTETRRTEERQRWLYRQGREEPYRDNPKVTWTLDSHHRWGLAADLAMQRRENGELIWTASSWRWLYRQVPPARYGLRHLAPTELVHLEHRWADEAIEEADTLKLVQT